MEKLQVEESVTLGFPPIEEMEQTSVSKSIAVIACGTMAFLYVAILYSPTVILRLPQPTTLNSFMIRRFVCAIISTILSIIFCGFLLPMGSWEFSAYGIRADHMWQAALFPLLLTSLMYAGTLVSKVNSFDCMDNVAQRFFGWIISLTSDVLVWRNYVVAPITEELVFRACMIPLLLCGGFKTHNIIFLSPIFFSLAHLNHFLELYCQQNFSFVKASLVVGLQLGYTVIFGWYASFLFIRTGNLVAPIVAHIFCNIMGLPVMHSKSKGWIIIAFVAGVMGFMWFLFPATRPDMYNENLDDCRCWHGFVSILSRKWCFSFSVHNNTTSSLLPKCPHYFNYFSKQPQSKPPLLRKFSSSPLLLFCCKSNQQIPQSLNDVAESESQSIVGDLLDYLKESWTQFHATAEAKRQLIAAGFNLLNENDDWDLKPGGRYFFTRNMSSLVAFAIGEKYSVGSGFHVIAAHTDSPCLKLKPKSASSKSGYQMVNVQTYGGGLWHTWFDRDLTVAGQVILKASDGSFVHKLVKVKRLLLGVPTLAIHLDRYVVCLIPVHTFV